MSESKAKGKARGRARAIGRRPPPRPAHAPQPDEAIAYIAALMRSLKFERGKTTVRLVDEWGLALTTIQGYAATASRLVNAEVNNREHVGATVGTALEQVIHKALADGDRRSVISAGETWANLSGAKAPVKIDIELAERKLESFLIAAKEEFPPGSAETISIGEVFERICRLALRATGGEASASDRVGSQLLGEPSGG